LFKPLKIVHGLEKYRNLYKITYMQSITYKKLVGVYSIIIFICYFTMVKVN
jgi:hypothetical protein